APRILKPQVAFEMADILRDVVQRGTAVRARALGRDDIGGKTGTTNEAKDAWFAGFHPTNATVVWMGFDQPATMGRREYGGVAALPVWMDFMKAQLKDTPKQWVSINNRAKSKRQQQKVIEMTDGGVVLDEDVDDIAKDTARAKPVKPSVQPRQPLEPEPVEEDAATTQSTNNSRSAIQNTPLAPTPAERMPPMPE
ncbi:penicillin-binding transpeptidase domain-containing protein, partial [Psychrobacter sp. T6-1]|uniref:penicillin-binding transpeptidase domain-containing protein n=1 Tax=Psychrobacter sp. T6-1 TaxID=3457447 RepID=UPI003FD2D6A6